MTMSPQAVLKSCFAAGAVFALSACNTMTGDRSTHRMSHAGMDHMMGAMLTGAAEVPGPGDPGGKGLFHYKLDNKSNQLCYQLKVDGIAAPTAAHIHEGAVGVAGGVVVMLQTPMLDRETDTCMNIEPALARRLMETPSSFYVNVHNAAYPNGAMRGQLMTMMHNM
jgi:hypothetical protein